MESAFAARLIAGRVAVCDCFGCAFVDVAAVAASVAHISERLFPRKMMGTALEDIA